MIKVFTCITQQHDIRLVLVAVLVCYVACFTALSLAARAAGQELRLTWLLAGGLAFGSGTWSAHFISMLAFNTHLPAGYDLTGTMVSVAVAMSGGAIGLALFLRPGRRWIDALLAGAVLGGSVGLMHFMGMAALRVAGHLEYDPRYVVASFIAGAALFGVARLAVSRIDAILQRLAGAGLLALAICTLHFTAMTSLSILPDATVELPQGMVGNQHLAIMVAVACLMVLIFGLAVAQFDQRLASHGARELAQFRKLADVTFSGVFVYREGVILDANAALCRFMGCQQSGLIGHRVSEFIAPDCLGRLKSRVQLGRTESEEFDVIVTSGERRTVEVVSEVIEYRGGDARVTALRDITERKRYDSLLAAEGRILTGIAENRPLPETLTETCAAAEAAVPDSLCSVLLVSADGRSLRTEAAPNLPPAYNTAIDGGLIGPAAGSCGTAAYLRRPVIVEDIATDPLWADYRDLALSHGLRACWSVPLIAKSGSVLGTFATYHAAPCRPSQTDLAMIDRLAASAAIAIQRFQLHQELIAAKDRAVAASRAKSEFLANMSHELRTPLNAILGFSEIISGQVLGAGAQARYTEYAKDIHDSGAHLLSLINDVLDVARVEAGKVRIDRERCNVAAAVEEQLRLIRRAYPEATAIAVQLEPATPDLMVDHRAFGQILINVMGNAAKFTPAEGRISVAGDWSAPGLRIRIADSGPGIPLGMLAELGKPFRQIESAYNRRHPGTGLGLYISRSLMRLHGGELEIASRPGEGTTVTLIFPEDCVLRGAERSETAADPELTDASE